MNRRSFLKTLGLAAATLPIYQLSGALPLRDRFHGETLILKTHHFYIMGSIMTVQGYVSDNKQWVHAVRQLKAKAQDLESRWSVFNQNSELSIFNRSNEGSRLSPDTIELIQYGLKIHNLTNGTFDMTVEPMMKAWGFRGDAIFQPRPTHENLQSLLSQTGMQNIDIEGTYVNKITPNVQLDPGGIGVGLMIDRVAECFTSNGIDRGILNHSGDIKALGAPPGESGWPIEIVIPEGSQPARVQLKNQSLATSAAYENRRKDKYGSWGHLLNPLTGEPVDSGWSVSIIASNTVLADGLSTAAYINPDLVHLPEVNHPIIIK